MTRRMMVAGVVLVASACWCLAAQAELAPAQKLAAETLIKQFSHRDFAVREHAVGQLIDMGPDVVPLVKKALAETTDNEVKLRCEMALKGVAQKYGVDVGLAAKAPARNWGLDTSRITLHVKNADLEDVLDAFAEQSGNRLVALPAEWKRTPLTLDVTDMPYWQALDMVCTVAGLLYNLDPATGELKLASAQDASDVSAYAGPVVVKLENATRTRSFRGGPGQWAQDMLNYRFTFFWEDRLEPIVAEADVTRAAADDGTDLKLTPVPTARAFMGGWGVARRTTAGQLFANITEVPQKLDKVARLEGVVKLALGEGQKSVKIEDILAGGEKTATLGDVTLTVVQVNRTNNWATMSVRLTIGGKETTVPVYPQATPYGFALLDPNGGRYAGMVFGGVLIRRALNAVGGGKQAAAVAQVVAVPGGKAVAGGGFIVGTPTSSVTFQQLPDIAGAWTLVYTMPEKSTEKEFEFRFNDVPLP